MEELAQIRDVLRLKKRATSISPDVSVVFGPLSNRTLNGELNEKTRYVQHKQLDTDYIDNIHTVNQSSISFTTDGNYDPNILPRNDFKEKPENS